jgi:hypothetical protein
VRPYPDVIEPPPRGVAERVRRMLRGRRLIVAAAIAVVEVVAVLVWRPNLLLVSAVAAIVFGVALWAAVRTQPGLLRDLLWIVAISQGMVIALPALFGLSLLAALAVMVLLLVLLVMLVSRVRF